MTALGWLRGTFILIGLTLFAAACGGSDTETSGQQVTPQAPGSTSAAAQATADPRANWPKRFRVGYFGGDDAEEVLRKQGPIKEYLEARLGMPVELFTGTSYGAVIEAMRADRVDAMLVGPFSYVLAVQEAKAEALAVQVSASDSKNPKFDPNVKPAYHSVVFTKKGSGITKLDDLRGKGFNFVDPASTSGHLAPKTLLIQKGINPDKDMRTVFAGTHPTSVISVWNDKAPAGATHESNLVNLANSGQIKWCAYPDGQVNKPRTEAEIKAVFDSCPDGSIAVLAQSDPIPNTPFAIRQELPASFKAEVKRALVEIKDQPELVTKLGYWYVDPSAEMKLNALDQFYNPLRDIAKLLNLNLKELQ
jgi:phosphonate transport system substrate-binding protein